MTHPLVTRLTEEFGYPALTTEAEIAAFTEAPGTHVIFVPGDARRNLETPDVAVVLPELRQAFQGRFDCAVAADSIETGLRESTGVLKTPSLIFFRDGQVLGGIPKVRDWSDYVDRITQLLAQPLAAE
ncbi:hydrogenase accessory protein [Mameliella sp. AT18]|uniref:hydrogenase accessory protein n=1 Tax=Mameliella sp. AT18 TaxID=3028385 RepID=UPI0008411C97|nr:hydrogenase accessory protein [Mameliella sp. AT18]MDD9730505.1 hydrogenase accessory protein [Mameliella sp. AT18]ODM48096.1 hydrogenase accessory protein [Ruegeria sp. PBVC088]